jgi:rod shape determining protein RodA
MASTFGLNNNLTIPQKLQQLNLGLILLVTMVACVGFVSLYSAAGGSYEPWVSKQLVRFLVGLVGMVVIALVDIRIWHRLSYFAYAGGLMLLFIVMVMGKIGMGAQRWIDLGVIQLQPSEIMKLAVVMALARYFHALPLEEIRRFRSLFIPAVIVLLPMGLEILQPDLGTALLTGLAGMAMFFIAGVSIWLFLFGIGLVGAAIPAAWLFALRDYQKQRIMTFINPESDPLGAGYHIMQSKIALGSGGIGGKGFLQGSQSHLNFLPEKQTDFIFTLFAEEWGLMGGLFLLGVFTLIFFYCGWIAFRCRQDFGRLLAFGLMINFSLYIFINTAMVMGLLPVVGVPLPMVSYGGTSMLAALAGFGLIMSCNIHRDSKIPRA